MSRGENVNPEDILTIPTFYDPFKAYVIKSKLESEGIDCFLADGNLLPTVSFFSNEGGVKLKIRREDRDKAIGLISNFK